jgi:alkylhydroperoxidase family enzyme
LPLAVVATAGKESAVATPFRITPAAPEALRRIEDDAPADLKAHLDMIKRGLEAIPGVPGEAIYGAVTLRALALKPDLFRSWFLMEHYSVKQGEIESSTKELLAAVISWRNEGDETPTCAPYHEGAARLEGADETAIGVARDWEARRGLVSERQRDLVDFGVKAAFAPRQVSDADVARVRRHGLSDAGLVELVSAALIAYNLSALNQVFNLIEGQG